MCDTALITIISLICVGGRTITICDLSLFPKLQALSAFVDFWCVHNFVAPQVAKQAQRINLELGQSEVAPLGRLLFHGTEQSGSSR